MKTVFAFLAVILFVAFSDSKAEDEDKKVRAKAEWIAFIKEDARLRTIISKIGKPDKISESGGLKLYMWGSRFDNDTTRHADLGLIVVPYHNEQIAVGIFNPDNSKPEFFPWAEKILAELTGKSAE